MVVKSTSMNFGVRRLEHSGQFGRQFHLFDPSGRLILVADHDSPWLPVQREYHVRFSRPSGELVATLGLPWKTAAGRPERQSLSYAIIFNHAVYAILNEQPLLDHQERHGSLPAFGIEVDGMTWIAVGDRLSEPVYAVYEAGEAPIELDPERIVAPGIEPVGAVYREHKGYDFGVLLPLNRLNRSALLALALVFLIDQVLLNELE